MSNIQSTDLDSFLPLLSCTDPKTKLSVGTKLQEYLSDPSNSIVCSDIGYFIDNLIQWLQCSNFKVVQLDLDILIELINRMNVDFQPYLSTSAPYLIDKLGDSKEIIRKKTLLLFRKLLECNVVSAQSLFDRIATVCFSHKNSNVREQIMHLLVDVLNTYGTSVLFVSKLIPFIVKLLGDPNVSVRSTAFDTLCDIYKLIGEKLRVDLQKKYSVPNNKLPALMSKFDEINASSATSVHSLFESLNLNGDETDHREIHFENMSMSAYRPPITPATFNSCTKKGIKKIMQVGAVTEDTFSTNFEDVPIVQIFSSKDVEDCFREYQDIIENVNEDWSKRVDCLKKIRSVIIAGGMNYNEFQTSLVLLLPAFLVSLKDLRSQVVREACVTIAYLSTKLKNKFDRFAESILNNLINLIQNSAKVISSSGLVCIRFILLNTHANRLIPIIFNNLNSKSKDIRRTCCEFMHLILLSWSPQIIERYVNNVQEGIKKGIADADPEARVYSRNAFAEFAQHFPDLAESLKNSLDYSYRKLLFCGPNSASNTSLTKVSPAKSITCASGSATFGRSSSAIDSVAAKRAKTRAQYAAMDRQKVGSGITLSKKSICTPSPTSPTSSTQQRNSRTNCVSISQPTSRSGSPSSRINYSHCLNPDSTSRLRRSSADNDTSRDSSLNRSGFRSHLPIRKPTSGQKVIQLNREIDRESIDFVDAFSCDNSLTRSKHLFKLDDHENLFADKDSTSYDSGISQTSSADQDIKNNYDFPDTQKDSNKLKLYIEELSDVDDEQTKKNILIKIKTLIQESSSDVIVTHFKLVLGKIISLISETEPPIVKEMALLLLQTIIKRKTVTFLLKQFSDLIIVRVISVCTDSCKEVSKAAETCAITLSTHLPGESVIRVIVPLVTSESPSIKLVAIKMLTRLIECSDESVTIAHIDQIMPVLLVAYDDPESSVRKSAVFCMVALHKQSEEMKIILDPYFSKLQGAKLKLLQLYIRRAEQGSSMPTSPRNA